MNESGLDFGLWKAAFNFAPVELPADIRKALASYIESGLDSGPWKAEFNFTPNELPADMRKALAPYFAGMGMPTGLPKFQQAGGGLDAAFLGLQTPCPGPAKT